MFLRHRSSLSLVASMLLAMNYAIAQEEAVAPFGVPPGDADFRFSEPLGTEERSGEDSAETLSDEIETDRDSFTPATSTAGNRRLILESAYSFIDNRHVAETHSVPEFIARYGASDRLELRLGWNYEVGGEGNSVSGGSGFSEPFEEAKIVSESQMIYGFKALLTDQIGWRPQSAFVVQGGTPTSGPDPASSFFATYVFGWQLPNRWKWDTSFRYGFDTEKHDHFNLWAPSTVLKRSIGERWNAHVEYFGIFSDGKAAETTKHYFSPGMHYLVTPDFEIGIRVGWGLNDQSANFFSNIGGGYRF